MMYTNQILAIVALVLSVVSIGIHIYKWYKTRKK